DQGEQAVAVGTARMGHRARPRSVSSADIRPRDGTDRWPSVQYVRSAPPVPAKGWSEWQDLNLRPPRPERGVFAFPFSLINHLAFALPLNVLVRFDSFWGESGAVPKCSRLPRACDPDDGVHSSRAAFQGSCRGSRRLSTDWFRLASTK